MGEGEGDCGEGCGRRLVKGRERGGGERRRRQRGRGE
jgi:hypothetical protein